MKSLVSEPDSPAGQAGRGLRTIGGGEFSEKTFFTCHQGGRGQGASRTVWCDRGIYFAVRNVENDKQQDRRSARMIVVFRSAKERAFAERKTTIIWLVQIP
jgi:hypothetical protein